MAGYASEFWLPWPPTANTMFGLKGYRRFPSKKYLEWRDDADEAVNQQRPDKIPGPVSIWIALLAPSKRKWDLDNRVKPIIDFCVGRGLIEDDHTEIVRAIHVSIGQQVGAEITVRGLTPNGTEVDELRSLPPIKSLAEC